ncbi:hypothetical protein ONE63_011424 [Megalurothrips usitatus]|uniref:Reverse transcriptase domain-containing protein n=1 Tax=Megalurothrips usitatus TaxID=439358 RepID=A0AAV7X5R4_9NEOP|nr:hypothetical protein ONE63_011424 [Megalurothrips usitatus]
MGNKVTRLPASVIVESGVVPCVTAPINSTLQSMGDKCIEVPKYAVLGEVYLMHPMEYHNSVTNNENECDYEEENEENIPILMTFVEHETKPFTDAEYMIEPSTVIPDDQPLPKDLQELADR